MEFKNQQNKPKIEVLGEQQFEEEIQNEDIQNYQNSNQIQENNDMQQEQNVDQSQKKRNKKAEKQSNKSLLRLEKDYVDGFYNEKQYNNEREFLVDKIVKKQEKIPKKPEFTMLQKSELFSKLEQFLPQFANDTQNLIHNEDELKKKQIDIELKQFEDEAENPYKTKINKLQMPGNKGKLQNNFGLKQAFIQELANKSDSEETESESESEEEEGDDEDGQNSLIKQMKEQLKIEKQKKMIQKQQKQQLLQNQNQNQKQMNLEQENQIEQENNNEQQQKMEDGEQNNNQIDKQKIEMDLMLGVYDIQNNLTEDQFNELKQKLKV
ncbi:hypothetical protein PPERSA_00082 [Pseudocohnilembus persalinus]|uniref:Uncharacterized protein n=1 Tax=Pseudocohnilembus persalinus TaxID=266149 RepID=A0A0V0QY85_PSEPJ|nr:hypothetical protein PPERSA_00082 [Pseudocohnilembus persalinus]|eukprot:KRX07172.1 hypothetical protein PPERSA_00082 [Pseudocohnilembus persalinus]